MDTTDHKHFSVLFQKVFGYDEDSKAIAFNKEKITKNAKNVLYLLGQLKSIHEKKRTFTAIESVHKYDEKKWTTNPATILELYHLAESSNYITPFMKEFNTSTAKKTIKPTLSPKDPNFPAWWEKHKSEWEDPRKDGQEPADD